jgi:hypothetical protein
VDFGELEDGSWIIIEAGDWTNAGVRIGPDLHTFISGIAETFSSAETKPVPLLKASCFFVFVLAILLLL